MGRIEIRIQCDDDPQMSVVRMMERLKDPKWNYSNLRQYLSLFTGEDVVWVDHVFQCLGENSKLNMILAWVVLQDRSDRLYCISVDEVISVSTEEKQ